MTRVGEPNMTPVTVPCSQCGTPLSAPAAGFVSKVLAHVNVEHPEVTGPGVNPAASRLHELDAQLAKVGMEGATVSALVRHHRNNEAAAVGARFLAIKLALEEIEYVRGICPACSAMRPDHYDECHTARALKRFIPDLSLDIRYEMIEQLHTAIYGATWARPESPANVWAKLVAAVHERFADSPEREQGEEGLRRVEEIMGRLSG